MDADDPVVVLELIADHRLAAITPENIQDPAVVVVVHDLDGRPRADPAERRQGRGVGLEPPLAADEHIGQVDARRPRELADGLPGAVEVDEQRPRGELPGVADEGLARPAEGLAAGVKDPDRPAVDRVIDLREQDRVARDEEDPLRLGDRGVVVDQGRGRQEEGHVRRRGPVPPAGLGRAIGVWILEPGRPRGGGDLPEAGLVPRRLALRGRAAAVTLGRKTRGPRLGQVAAGIVADVEVRLAGLLRSPPAARPFVVPARDDVDRPRDPDPVGQLADLFCGEVGVRDDPVPEPDPRDVLGDRERPPQLGRPLVAGEGVDATRLPAGDRPDLAEDPAPGLVAPPLRLLADRDVGRAAHGLEQPPRLAAGPSHERVEEVPGGHRQALSGRVRPSTSDRPAACPQSHGETA